MVEGVSAQLNKALEDYVKKIDETTDGIMEDVAKAAAADLKKTSPKKKGKGGGKYARSWTVSKKKHQFIVHNKKYYRLTHLLENGHVIKNAYGTYGTTAPQRHIAPAQERAEQKLLDRLKKEL